MYEDQVQYVEKRSMERDNVPAAIHSQTAAEHVLQFWIEHRRSAFDTENLIVHQPAVATASG